MFFKRISDSIDLIMERDPAARSRLEVVLCYPGFHALTIYRLAHELWEQESHTAARVLSHIARMLTGIEIHPGATIGERVIIDHGMGVVIGETAVVGDECFLYQGVTLGAGAAAREGDKTRGMKRHPTLGAGVIVGSGAEIQGDITIGDNVRVASGSIVLKDVPANSIVVGVPGRVIYKDGKRVGPSTSTVPDIEAEAIKSLKQKLEHLERVVYDLTDTGAATDSSPGSRAAPDYDGEPGDSDPVDVFLQGAGI